MKAEEFNKVIDDFKPIKEVFNICQNLKDRKTSPTRNKLYMCSCGVKVRCAIELNATCNNCNTKFIKSEEGENDD